MKKIIVTIIATIVLFSATALTGCKKEEPAKAKDVNIETVVESIKSQIEFPEMADITLEQVELSYQIPVKEIEKAVGIISGGGSTADEVLAIKMKETADMAATKKLIDARIVSQKDTFVSYNAQEVPKIETAVVVEKGRYLFVAVTNDNTKAKKIISEAI